MGYHIYMYNNDIIKYLDDLISSAIINGQNKIKFFSRGEKDLLRHKKDDKYIKLNKCARKKGKK